MMAHRMRACSRYVAVGLVLVVCLLESQYVHAAVPVERAGAAAHRVELPLLSTRGQDASPHAVHAREHSWDVPDLGRLVRRNARRWNGADLHALGLAESQPLDAQVLVARQDEGDEEVTASPEAEEPTPSLVATPTPTPTLVAEESDNGSDSEEDTTDANNNDEVLDAKGTETTETSRGSGGFSALTIGIAVVLGAAVIGLMVMGISRYRGYGDVEASMPFNRA